MNTKQAESRINTTIVAYISFPYSDDVVENISFARDIIENIHLQSPEIVPLAPCLIDWIYSKIHEDQLLDELSRKSRLELITQNFIDEMWLYGKEIDKRMSHEIVAAILKGIKVVPKSPETEKIFNKTFAHVKTA